MIKKVKIRYFKQFKKQEFDLSDHIVLAGPNNSGKTTLLQAIMLWYSALNKLKIHYLDSKNLELSKNNKSTPRRFHLPITTNDFIETPIPDMKWLWTDGLSVTDKSAIMDEIKDNQRRLEITLEDEYQDKTWKHSFSFEYQSSDLIYFRITNTIAEDLSKILLDFNVIYLSPFSSIESKETRYDRPYIDLQILKGNAKSILRNLLLELYQNEDKQKWQQLIDQIQEIFSWILLPPDYENQPFIICEYQKNLSGKIGNNSSITMDISCAGSGFYQVLLLLALFYARPGSIFLLDEPDAHLHVILQKQIYDTLRRIARQQSCQLIIATHSEVLINSTDPESVLSFYKQPHYLIHKEERKQLVVALTKLTALDLLLAEQSPGILYVEGEDDFHILKAWAKVLQHPLWNWFSNNPLWHENLGRHPREAKDHFFALRAVTPNIQGCLLLDGDHRKIKVHEVKTQGLKIDRWKRYEIESYLIHPHALHRFIQVPKLRESAEKYLRNRLPPEVFNAPLKNHEYFIYTPVSKSLLPDLFAAIGLSITKNEYYLIAEQMLPEEIPPEVKEKLDAIQHAFGL